MADIRKTAVRNSVFIFRATVSLLLKFRISEKLLRL
jgi:hypothetical protein